MKNPFLLDCLVSEKKRERRERDEREIKAFSSFFVSFSSFSFCQKTFFFLSEEELSERQR